MPGLIGSLVHRLLQYPACTVVPCSSTYRFVCFVYACRSGWVRFDLSRLSVFLLFPSATTLLCTTLYIYNNQLIVSNSSVRYQWKYLREKHLTNVLKVLFWIDTRYIPGKLFQGNRDFRFFWNSKSFFSPRGHIFNAIKIKTLPSSETFKGFQDFEAFNGSKNRLSVFEYLSKTILFRVTSTLTGNLRGNFPRDFKLPFIRIQPQREKTISINSYDRTSLSEWKLHFV